MKNFKPNEKYTKIAIYSVITIICCVLFILFLINLGFFGNILKNFLTAIMPIFYGIIFAFLLYPLVSSYERMLKTFIFKKKNHPKLLPFLALLFAYLTVLIILFVLIFSIFPLLTSDFSTFNSDITPKILNVYNTITDYDGNNQFLKSLYSKTSEYLNIEKLIGFVNPATIVSVVMTFLGGIYNIIIGVIISIYLLASRKKIQSIFGKIFVSMFSPAAGSRIMLFLIRLYTNIMQFLSIRTLSSLYIACICYTVCWISRVPFYSLITLLIFIGNLIPVFGPVIVTALLALFMALVSRQYVLLLLIILISVQIFDTIFIENTMLDSKLRPSLGLTIVLLIIAFSFFGFIGALICIPAFATIRVEAKAIYNSIMRKREKKKSQEEK